MQILDAQQQYKEQIQASYPAFSLRRNGSNNNGNNNNGSPSSMSNGTTSIATSSMDYTSDFISTASLLDTTTITAPPPPITTTKPIEDCSPPNGWDTPAALSLAEVHLRRLDQLEFLHRRAVAAITINAPVDAVWQVLTDYDRLAEFVPNLAISERIALPAAAPKDVVRLRQVGMAPLFLMVFLYIDTVHCVI